MNRKYILFFLCFLLCSVPVFADDELQNDSEPIQADIPDTTSSSPVVIDITQLLNSSDKTSNSDTDDVKEVITLEPELVNMTQSLQRVSAEDTSGLKSVLLSILGDYETVITDYEYRTGTSNYTSHSINIERDWAWLCSCGIFAILLYCTFKTIGAIGSKF